MPISPPSNSDQFIGVQIGKARHLRHTVADRQDMRDLGRLEAG